MLVSFLKSRSLLEKRKPLAQIPYDYSDYFIFCLEGVHDVGINNTTETQRKLKELALQYGIASIYKNCDSIEGLEDSLNALVLEDHQFKNYEIIYFVMTGEANSICLNHYHYDLQEIAEIFEGKLTNKIIHFSNTKILDLEEEEAQYFLDVTSAKGISGYGKHSNGLSSVNLDKAFFHLFQNDNNMLNVVEDLHQKYYNMCKQLDFRLYY